jgi:hypothetical protein
MLSYSGASIRKIQAQNKCLVLQQANALAVKNERGK